RGAPSRNVARSCPASKVLRQPHYETTGKAPASTKSRAPERPLTTRGSYERVVRAGCLGPVGVLRSSGRMEPASVEIKSTGVAVERLGRVRELAWFFLALSVPVAVFTGWGAFGTAVPSGGSLRMLFWASVLAFLGSAGRLLQLRFEPSLSARAGLRS